MDQNKKIIYFDHLDVLRFISALLVLVLHAFDKGAGYFGWPQIFYFSDGTESSKLQYFKTIVNNCAYGVDVFFLISGFLITYLLLVEKDKTGTIGVKHFYVRRVLRIWPLYFLIIFLGPIFTFYLGENRPNYGMHLLFLGNFSLIKEGWVSANVSHLWSICIEEHFYLIWPLLAKFLSKKNFFRAMVVLLGAVFVYKMYLNFASLDVRWMTFYLSTFSRADTLLLGAISGYIYYSNPFEVKIPGVVRIVTYLIFILILMFDNISVIDNIFDAVFKKFFYCLFVLFWFLNFMFNKDAKFAFKKGMINYLGKASYSFYMWHPLVLALVVFSMNQAGMNSVMFCFAVTLILSLFVSVLSYEYFEKPFLKIKDKLFSKYKS